jgi:hypothetical protein
MWRRRPMKKMSIQLARVIVVLVILPAIGLASGEQFSVGQFTGRFTTEVIAAGTDTTIMQNFVDNLTHAGGTCLPGENPMYHDYTYCEIQKTSFGEHIFIGTERGVGIDDDKARIVVEFTLYFKKKINLNVFPTEFRNLIKMIGGSL